MELREENVSWQIILVCTLSETRRTSNLGVSGSFHLRVRLLERQLPPTTKKDGGRGAVCLFQEGVAILGLLLSLRL